MMMNKLAKLTGNANDIIKHKLARKDDKKDDKKMFSIL